MDQKTANDITEYKIRERLARRKVLNALLILIEAEKDAKSFDVETSKDGKFSGAGEFYQEQMKRVAGFYATLWQLKDQFHGLLLQAQAVDASLFFGEVPPKKKE